MLGQASAAKLAKGFRGERAEGTMLETLGQTMARYAVACMARGSLRKRDAVLTEEPGRQVGFGYCILGGYLPGDVLTCAPGAEI